MKLTKKEMLAMGLNPQERVIKNRDNFVDDPTERKPAHSHRDKLFDAACAAHGLPVPDQEYRFCPGRKWRFDYLFGGLVALEIEGGLFGVGTPCPTCKRRTVAGHSSIERIKKDMEKYNEAAIMGFIVVRCLPEDIDSGAAFALVRRALQGEGEQS